MERVVAKRGRPLGPTSRVLSMGGGGSATLERSSGSASSASRSSVPGKASSSLRAVDVSLADLPLDLALALDLEAAEDDLEE